MRTKQKQMVLAAAAMLGATSFAGAAVIMESNFEAWKLGAGAPSTGVFSNQYGKNVICEVGGTLPATPSTIGVNAPYPATGNEYQSIVTTNSFTSLSGNHLTAFADGPGAEVLIVPNGTGSSFAAMSQVVDSQRQMKGGFDFFFRTDNDISQNSEFRVLDTKTSTGGIRGIFYSYNKDLDFNLSFPTNGFTNYTNIQNSPSPSATGMHIADGSTFPIDANKIYHLAVSFDTDAAGLVTVQVFAKEGTGAIDPSLTTDRVGAASFDIAELVTTASFFYPAAGGYQFGIIQNLAGVARTQEFDRLRLYDAKPLTFEALPVPEPGSLGLIGLAAVGALSRRRRR